MLESSTLVLHGPMFLTHSFECANTFSSPPNGELVRLRSEMTRLTWVHLFDRVKWSQKVRGLDLYLKFQLTKRCVRLQATVWKMIHALGCVQPERRGAMVTGASFNIGAITKLSEHDLETGAIGSESWHHKSGRVGF